MGNSSQAITVAGLTKSFGNVRALDGLDLSVATGEVLGFLGPNGAGKSTTIRVLLGLIRADSGTATLLGGDPWRDGPTLHKRIAYVPGDVSLWPNLTGGETIDLLAQLRGGLDRARRQKLIERFELDPRKDCRTYSKGNRQKVALVASFCTNADLLIFDEPTTGLDPLMGAVFRECVLEEKAKGRTIVLSSHILSEVEALCDRVSIIRAGKIVEQGTLAELRHLTRTIITADVPAPVPGLGDIAGVHDVHVDGGHIRFAVEGAGLAPALALLASANVRSLSSAPPTLEDLFMRHYRSSGSNQPAAHT